jgi:hypothetical protein
MQLILKFFADLRLTIVLLAMSLLMVFFGTLDQTNVGIKGSLERYFEGYFHAWQYPEEWPGGTIMVFALNKDDPKAGQKLSMGDLAGYEFVGFNDNTYFNQSKDIYKKAGKEGPTHKFPDLSSIKAYLQEGGRDAKRVAVLPDSAIVEELKTKTLAASKIKGEPGISLRIIHVPVFGGYVLGPLLFLNLIAAHFARFKLTWKKSGVFIIHAGLILMLLSELVTDLTDRESLMVIEEGETAWYSTDFDKNEVFLLDRSKPNKDTLLSVPTKPLAKGKFKGKLLDLGAVDPRFPFQLKIVDFYENAELDFHREEDRTDGFPIRIGDRDARVVAEHAEKTHDPMEINYVSALVEVLVGDKTYGPFFISNRLEFLQDYRHHTFEHEGKEFAIGLRRQRYYYDFGVRLDDFRFLKYPGTEKPKDFTSDVTLLLPEGAEEKKRIYMNHPLFHDGSTFYQSGWNERTEKGTRLQVVQNPGKTLPYWGVAVVGVGLVVQFLMSLGKFAQRRAREQKKEDVQKEATV